MTDQLSLGFEVQVQESFDQAIEKVTTALKREGFGVLTRIDMHKTLKEKIGVDFHPYAILGACNPSFAYKSLTSEPTVGLLLPCNVTVEENPSGGSVIRIVNPIKIMMAGDFSNPTVGEVAQQVSEHLVRVADSLK